VGGEGGAGTAFSGGAAGVNGGGAGAGGAGGGGGGGGASDMRTSPASAGLATDTRLLVAGGGGGGGGGGSAGCRGGASAYTGAQSGASAGSTTGGGGATDSSGGTAGTSTGTCSSPAAGAIGQGGAGGGDGGGNLCEGGGGGGGGVYGGGGGGAAQTAAHGAGGGGGSRRSAGVGLTSNATVPGGRAVVIVGSAPVAHVVSPGDGRTFHRLSAVATAFSCEGSDVGVAGCRDDQGAYPPGGALDTDTLGQFTYTVTATDGLETATDQIAYTIIDALANLEPPAITGVALPGRTLSCSTGSWSGSPIGFSYEFRRDGAAIDGATAATYTPTAGDTGHALTCVVTAHDAVPSSASATSPAVAIPPPPANIAAPAISGTPATAQTLSCSTGTWSGDPTGFTYAWTRDGAPIPGATGSTYVTVAADDGTAIACIVTAQSPQGSTQASSAAVAIKGSPLTCSGLAVALLELTPKGGKVRVFGITLPRFAGQTVTIIRPTGMKGSAVVQSDGTFTATVAKPKTTGRIRFQAMVAGQRGAALSLTRKFSSTSKGRTVDLRINRRVSPGTTITITRQIACDQRKTFKTLKLPRSGRVRVTLPKAGPGQLTFYRATGRVGARRGGKGKTFTLPIAVRG